MHLEDISQKPPFHPLCEFWRPLVYIHAQHRLPVTHQLLTGRPLPLIPFLFGFNEPNPLSHHEDKGEVIGEQVAVQGDSRKVTLGLRSGVSGPLLSAHTPCVIHTTAPRGGIITVPTRRARCCLVGLHSVCGHGEWGTVAPGAICQPWCTPCKSFSREGVGVGFRKKPLEPLGLAQQPQVALQTSEMTSGPQGLAPPISSYHSPRPSLSRPTRGADVHTTRLE